MVLQYLLLKFILSRSLFVVIPEAVRRELYAPLTIWKCVLAKDVISHCCFSLVTVLYMYLTTVFQKILWIKSEEVDKWRHHFFQCTKMMFSIKNFFSKCHQIRSFLRIWSLLLKKSLTEDFIFCAVLSQGRLLLILSLYPKI